MRSIDLTHLILPNMPVYPGTKPPEFKPICSLEQEGFVETELNLYSHTGTHIDSPAHIISGGKTLDLFGTEYFLGPAMVIDVSRSKEISLAHLTPLRAELQQVRFVILYTGWDQHWGTEEYFKDFPVLTAEAAKWLVSLGLKGVCIDAISVDAVKDTLTLPIHRILLGNDVLVIENLTNLQELIGVKLTFCCLPIKTKHADGAPARAIAIL
ncbi:cyclase family protein [Desulforamulus aquiferis]|uniref:Cyclase family protein n=1 Tax=Desulforamulus aquiferis TaxID=1397668 RepID=A0AAW7ZF34_9FIRM|nr:cyclase family protein [Desulforamulus aquiferis]MDO7788105.1 cyclase family protein [Desulforamulus aquiferis]